MIFKDGKSSVTDFNYNQDFIIENGIIQVDEQSIGNGIQHYQVMSRKN